MSWNLFKSQADIDAEWKQQKIEYQGVAHTVIKLSTKCFKRCAKDVTKSDLSTAEMLCLDRCTRKYIHAINTVSLRTEEISRKYATNT